MWRRFATQLRTLGPARCATKPVRCAVGSSAASRNVIRTFSAVSRHFSTESVGNASAIRVDDILSIATGHEREELEAFLKGKDLAEIDYPEGPFGTKEAPAVIKSSYDRRIVGCPGVEGEDEHDVVWFWLEKGKTHECPVCSQCFAIRRGIVYGNQPRNRLDLYFPKNRNEAKPVVAFVTGGAWIIGYKAWGSILGQQLSERDVIVACIDYRNFPQGTIGDMVKDASQGITFVCNNIAEYGGDPSRIYLMGQSAGSHIAACVLLEQAIKEAEGEKISWSVSQLKSFFGLSGGYNLFNLVDHLHSQGLYQLSISKGAESLRRYSPEVIVREPNARRAVSLLPPIILFHGTADSSIPSDSSKSFAETLQTLGVEADSILYEGKTHTDLFLQDPMRGGIDAMFEDLVSMIHAGDSEAIARDSKAPPRRRLVPEFMLDLARTISPF